MNTTFPTKKIAGIIEEIKMNPIIDSYLVLELSLSLSYPEGKTAYFKKKIFELQEQISKESYIGYSWVSLGCVYAVDPVWLQKCMTHFYKKETEKTAWEALELFLRKYFQLLDYEKICKEVHPVDYIPENGSEKKYPDKYYAWYHGISIALRIEKPFPNNFEKKEIVEFGNKTYGTGEGFYKEIFKLDITQTYTFINSMNQHDRANWKKIIIDISGNNAKIIDYLSKFPN